MAGFLPRAPEQADGTDGDAGADPNKGRLIRRHHQMIGDGRTSERRRSPVLGAVLGRVVNEQNAGAFGRLSQLR